MALGYLTEEQLHAFFSKQPGMTSIELSRLTIDGELLKLIPKELALDRLVLPIDQIGKLLTVAMACPLDTGTINEVHKLTGLKVKAMLCKMGDIGEAVQKYYPEEGDKPKNELSLSSFGLKTIPEEEIEIEKMGDAISALEVLGARADVIARVQDLASSENSSMRDVALAVGMDPILAVSLLRTANSEAYGLQGKVDSVHMAAALLGKEGTAAIASRCVNGGTAVGVDIGFLSDRACRCARASVALAKASGRVGIGVSYTAGLLCEVGRFALAALSPENYKKIDVSLYSGALVEAEKKYFSHCHREAGASLAKEWALPASLQQIMLYYLTPEHAGNARDIASVISIASMVAGTSGKLEVAALQACTPALEHIGLSEEVATKAIEQALQAK
jgi:HD-like signal output (HDOD) protein